MSAPVMALLPDLGIETATLSDATVGGFGFDFGLSFGAVTVLGAVNATLSAPTVTAVLSGDVAGTATLAGNGVSTALPTGEVLAIATIHLT